MQIGLDAGMLSVTDQRLKVGVYAVVYNLLKELGGFDNQNNYRLYSFDPIQEDILQAFGDRMENRVVWPQKSWATISLPLELARHPVDIFLGTSQMVPSFSGVSVGFVYDTAFLKRKESYPGSYSKLVKQTADLVKRSSHIITISETVKKDIISRYDVSPSDITVAYPGIDSRFRGKIIPYSHPRPYFLFVGALKPGKNVPGIIRAFSRFRKTSAKAYDLILVGGNYWPDPEIEEAIAESGYSENIIMPGYVHTDKLPSYFSGAVAFVSPSHYEGFCLPAVEAMASGCPVIGSTSGAMKETVGNAGILVNPTDISAIARTMHDLSYNAKLHDSYAKKGIQKARQYTWSEFAKTVHGVIRSVSGLS